MTCFVRCMVKVKVLIASIYSESANQPGSELLYR